MAIVKVKKAPASALAEVHNSLFPLNDEKWEIANLSLIADKVVEISLELLEDQRASNEIKQEILLWIAEPLVHDSHVKYRPGSFQMRCIEAGLDPEFLQREVLRIKAPRLFKYLFN